MYQPFISILLFAVMKFAVISLLAVILLVEVIFGELILPPELILPTVNDDPILAVPSTSKLWVGSPGSDGAKFGVLPM